MYNRAMVTSRQRLYAFIEQHGPVSIQEISRAMHMTAANARHHLNILLEQGVVEVVGERAQGGKGRPSLLYALASQAQENNLDRLAGAGLEILAEQMPENYLEALARRLDESANGPLTVSGGSLTQRLVGAVQRLNRMNYRARWEAHSQAPRLILGHCPYAALLASHPEMCQMDARLLGRLVGGQAEPRAIRARDTRGLLYCLFAILPDKPKPAAA